MKVTNLELNGNTYRAIAKRVMKDRNIHIVDKFTPVVSEHIIHIKPKRRIVLKLTEDQFSSCEQRLYANNKWKTTSEFLAFDNGVNNLEDYFINEVINIMNMYKNIK